MTNMKSPVGALRKIAADLEIVGHVLMESLNDDEQDRVETVTPLLIEFMNAQGLTRVQASVIVFATACTEAATLADALERAMH